MGARVSSMSEHLSLTYKRLPTSKCQTLGRMRERGSTLGTRTSSSSPSRLNHQLLIVELSLGCIRFVPPILMVFLFVRHLAKCDVALSSKVLVGLRLFPALFFFNSSALWSW